MSQPASRPTDEPVGALVHRLSEQIPELVRSELRLAQAELSEKGRRAGLGIGMFSVAGKKEVDRATPPAPERTIASVKQDVAAMKGARS